jgi:hypothetical protein
MQASTNPSKKRKKTFFVLLLFSVGVGLIYLFLRPNHNTSFQPVSLADLKGVWTTVDPKYEDRFLQFGDDSITFGWGADGMGSYTLHEINSKLEADGMLVHVRYTDLTGNTYQLNFFYEDQGGGLLWMKNQKGIYWLHTNDQPIHHPQFN